MRWALRAVDRQLVHARAVRVAVDHAADPRGAEGARYGLRVDVHDVRHGARGVLAAAGA